MKKAPGAAPFGFFIVWACIVTIALLFLDDAMSLSFKTPWHVIRFILPFVLLVGFGLYLWEGQKSVMRRLHQLTITDPLTGAYNRLFLFDELERVLALRDVVSVIFIDIDGFKRYNDARGHAAGDEVLRLLVLAVKSYLTGEEFIARYGGDEFVVVLFRTAEGAEEFLRVVREKFRRYSSVSFSAGVAVARAGDTPESLIARADEDMYRRKRG